MKITELQLVQYGIYKNAAWRPSLDSLNIVMGPNESGKTTMLRFIRDMLFGYPRGKWQGRKGNMTILRSDGERYRIFREEKKSWIVDGNHETFKEELPQIWWHGLDRKIYEEIFAVGLEDLQGLSFMSRDTVRSRFFMMQGAEHLAKARDIAQKEMGELLVASPTGKRKINRLVSELKEINETLDSLSAQEKDFAQLQKKQEQLKKELSALSDKLEHERQRDRFLEKNLGAWEYYQRAKSIKKQLDLSEGVKVFPTGGREHWNKLMQRMKVIHDQKESVQEKIGDYRPKTKQDMIPWASVESDLDALYIELGQWRDTIHEAEAIEEARAAWQSDFEALGYTLSFWKRSLSPDEPWGAIDWEAGYSLARTVLLRKNEIHFWKQREPEVESAEEIQEEESGDTSEKEFRSLEESASLIQSLLRREKDIRGQMELISAAHDRHRTLLMGGFISLAASLICALLFYTARAGYLSLYGLAFFAVLSLLFFVIRHHRKGSRLKKLQDLRQDLEDIEKEKSRIAPAFGGNIPHTEAEMPAFEAMMQEKRAAFYQLQAKRQADSWKNESIKKQRLIHKDWAEEGKNLTEKLQDAETMWNRWLETNHLPWADSESIAILQEQWQGIYAELGKGKILDVRLGQMKAKLAGYEQRAKEIREAAGIAYAPTPEGMASLYEETRSRNMEWQTIAERNRQYEAYMNEVRGLQDKWDSCNREMKTLLDMVGAKDAEEFARKVEAYENHDALLKEWERVKRDLRLYAGSDQSFELLWKSLESGQYDEWMNEHHTITARIEQDQEKQGLLQKELGGVDNEIFHLASDDTITKVLQRKAGIETEIKLALSEWLTRLYTDRMLEKTQALYESGSQPRVVAKANEFLQSMTQGKYSLSVSPDGKDVVIEDAAHRVKEAGIWSSGTGDQVYLAIRLAMALSFGKQVERLPIILDDIFVRFDEIRQRETLKFLMELGKTQQVFLFTCHERTVKIAREVGKEAASGSFTRLENGMICEMN